MAKEVDYDKLFWFVDTAVAELVRKYQGARGGGYFNLRDSTGTLLYEDCFRSPVADKKAKYRRFASEKTQRLSRYPAHVLSWQSKNDKLEQYQGGVRAPGGSIGAFSGFPAEEDEALVLWVFTKLGLMSEQEALAASLISSNSCCAPLWNLFNKAAEKAD